MDRLGVYISAARAFRGLSLLAAIALGHGCADSSEPASKGQGILYQDTPVGSSISADAVVDTPEPDQIFTIKKREFDPNAASFTEVLIRNIATFAFALAGDAKDESTYLTLSREQLLTQAGYDAVRILGTLGGSEPAAEGQDRRWNLSSRQYREVVAGFKAQSISLGDFAQGGLVSGSEDARRLIEVKVGYWQQAALEGSEAQLVTAPIFGVRSYDATSGVIEVFGMYLGEGDVKWPIESLAWSPEEALLAYIKDGEARRIQDLDREALFSMIVAFIYSSEQSAEDSSPGVIGPATELSEKPLDLSNVAKTGAAVVGALKFLAKSGSVVRARYAFLIKRWPSFRELYDEKIGGALRALGVDPLTNKVEVLTLRGDLVGISMSKPIELQQEDVIMTIPASFDLQFSHDPAVMAVHGISGVKNDVFLNQDATLRLQTLRLDGQKNELEVTIEGSFKILIFDQTKKEYLRYPLTGF